MPQPEAPACIIEEWFRLPESRRLHATDAVVFAFRLMRDRPEMLAPIDAHQPTIDHATIVGWLLPYLHREQLTTA